MGGEGRGGKGRGREGRGGEGRGGEGGREEGGEGGSGGMTVIHIMDDTANNPMQYGRLDNISSLIASINIVYTTQLHWCSRAIA